MCIGYLARRATHLCRWRQPNGTHFEPQRASVRAERPGISGKSGPHASALRLKIYKVSAIGRQPPDHVLVELKPGGRHNIASAIMQFTVAFNADFRRAFGTHTFVDFNFRSLEGKFDAISVEPWYPMTVLAYGCFTQNRVMASTIKRYQQTAIRYFTNHATRLDKFSR